jgi:ABC-type multidrug transport system ATPase subunit
MMNAIEVRNLRKSFGDFLAVQDVSFHADSGEVLSLLGPNGAGKSTTISMLSGLLAPIGGNASIMGHSVTKEPEAAKASLGVVPSLILPAYALGFFVLAVWRFGKMNI